MSMLRGMDVRDVTIKKTRESGTQRAKRRFRGHNVIWRRITAAFDDELKRFGANPAMVAPLSRWVLFGHISKTQAMAGRYYASIVRKFERYCLPIHARHPRSGNLEPIRAEDEELERHISNGTLSEFEADARHAKRQYRRAMKVLDRFLDPVTGRNYAKDTVDTVCLAEEEVTRELRRDVGAVLTAIAKEFGLGDYNKKDDKKGQGK